jgi:sortase A
MLFPKKNFHANFSALLTVIGSLLLGYVAVQYGTMFRGQRKLERQWEAQQRNNAQGYSAASMSTADEGLTRLSIPKLNFAAVVVEGITRPQLLLGPGHMPDTPQPGAPGNSVISGHRDTFFRRIIELDKGDQVVVERSGNRYTYEVDYKKVVQPTDLSVTEATSDARLTLLTCYPIHYIGPAPQRLVVVARLVKAADAPPAKLAVAALPAGPRGGSLRGSRK